MRSLNEHAEKPEGDQDDKQQAEDSTKTTRAIAVITVVATAPPNTNSRTLIIRIVFIGDVSLCGQNVQEEASATSIELRFRGLFPSQSVITA